MALAAALVQPAAGQEIIVHGHAGNAEKEDGTAKDADGDSNGVCVWKGGGTVHVISGSFGVGYDVFHKPYTLIIEPGAIVKVAGRFQIINGNLDWLPPGGLYAGTNTFFSPPALQMDSVTITDIRDDEVGGDTNQDGNNSVPPSERNLGITLEFSGAPHDYLRNSTLRFVDRIRDVGSMDISGNRFFMCGAIVLDQNRNDFIGAIPYIAENIFEFSRGHGNILQIRDMSPIIQSNLFRYAVGRPPLGSSHVAVIDISHVTNRPTPQSGTTFILNNRFETGGGIQIRTFSENQSYEIRDNTFQGIPNVVGGKGGACLELEIGARAVITDNEVNNYSVPLDLYALFSTSSQLQINNNRFGIGDYITSPRVVSGVQPWQNGIFVNAKNNFWGDPTGPRDNSNADGLHNPRGKGLQIGDGIDYLPFIGGTAPSCEQNGAGASITSQSGGNVCPDEIHITARAVFPPEPAILVPGIDAILNVKVDKYTLNSAPAGKIFILVRDANRIVLNRPGASVNVTAQTTTAEFPVVEFKVPEFSKIVTVEADLAPDGDIPATTSNLVPFRVDLPASKFTITNVTGVPSGRYPSLIPGNKTKIRFTFNYTLATNGRFEIDLKEKTRKTGVVLLDFPLVTLDVPSGNNKTVEQEVELDIPLRDVLLVPESEVLYQVTLKDDASAVVGKEGFYLDIDRCRNRVLFGGGFGHIVPGVVSNGNLKPTGRKYFLVGEKLTYFCKIIYNIDTREVNNWQFWFYARALDSEGDALYIYPAHGPVRSNVSTGHIEGLLFDVITSTALPAGTRKLRVQVRMIAPNQNLTVAENSTDVEVRDQPTQSSQKAVPAGASQVAFTPIPVTLNFASNQKAGAAFAEEFAGQFGSTAASTALAKTNTFYWKFIPLKRYWAVYDTLQDGTFSATVSFTYNPATDFPAVPEFKEDSLVVAGFNPLSQELEALPSTLNKTTRTVATAYTKFFNTYVVASKATVLTTAVSSKPEVEIPAQFSLAQNYPNPFNPTTVISFQLPVNSHVTLKVFDVFGREVVTLVDKKFSAGRYDVHWDATGHASRVYFYRLQAEGNFAQTKKLLLVK